MNINKVNVTYSSIVKIGEDVKELENKENRKILKLHRGVIDVIPFDVENVSGLKDNLYLNNKSLQQYGENDGDAKLIESIKNNFSLLGDIIITPGGMAALDIIIESLSDYSFYVPNYHWGSWNKILKTHNKWISNFDDMDLDNFNPTNCVVMLCYPSNPTGYMPSIDSINSFLKRISSNKVTVILDLPYFLLYNEDYRSIYLHYDNVILVSSFSKTLGLSGYRVGYIHTMNKELYSNLKIRSLYKYNSVSVLPQSIINLILEDKSNIEYYKNITISNIKDNIQLLKDKDLLFDGYPNTPIGPFVIINKDYNYLLENNISSVPLNKFCLPNINCDDNLSRISVAVPHEEFKNYFNKI